MGEAVTGHGVRALRRCVQQFYQQGLTTPGGGSGDGPLSVPAPTVRTWAPEHRVPPATRTAREGVAWTFGLGAEAYEPLEET